MAPPDTSLRTYKGHFTRTERELDRVLDFVRDNPSPRGEAEVEENLAKLKKFGSKVEELCLEILDAGPQDPAPLEASLDDVAQRVSSTQPTSVDLEECYPFYLLRFPCLRVSPPVKKQPLTRRMLTGGMTFPLCKPAIK
eukprot:snap_masked-scaffold148_size310697-processed-gene-0.9 protein:Tk10299 transcript:snap_masked-scaffold148_size310697-processed-gene-0.9-mRNA-1 annotation:"Nesprin-1"